MALNVCLYGRSTIADLDYHIIIIRTLLSNSYEPKDAWHSELLVHLHVSLVSNIIIITPTLMLSTTVKDSRQLTEVNLSLFEKVVNGNR